MTQSQLDLLVIILVFTATSTLGLTVMLTYLTMTLNGVKQRINYLLLRGYGVDGDYVGRHKYGKDFLANKNGIMELPTFQPKPSDRYDTAEDKSRILKRTLKNKKE